jgi:hypothetical protein
MATMKAPQPQSSPSVALRYRSRDINNRRGQPPFCSQRSRLTPLSNHLGKQSSAASRISPTHGRATAVSCADETCLACRLKHGLMRHSSTHNPRCLLLNRGSPIEHSILPPHTATIAPKALSRTWPSHGGWATPSRTSSPSCFVARDRAALPVTIASPLNYWS